VGAALFLYMLSIKFSKFSALYTLKLREIALVFYVPTRRDFRCIARAIQWKSQRSWRVKEQASCEDLGFTECWSPPVPGIE